MSEINLRLRDIRRGRNISQEALAHHLGISRQAVIALEQGVSLPSLPVILAILRVLDIPFTDLFGKQWSPFRENQSKEAAEKYGLAIWPQDSHRTIPLQMIEDDTALYLTAELAGIVEEDVTIDLGIQHLLIGAIRRSRFFEESICHQDEIHVGHLLRIVSLPFPIDTSRAHAEFTRGMLYLTLPKQLPSLKRRVTFKSNTRNNPSSPTNKELHGSE